MLGVAWLAGPIAGIVVQPIVGELSDTCTAPCGARRLWMWFGTLGQLASMAVMALSPDLGRMLGDTKGEQNIALWLSVAAFWLADCFLNAQQAPARSPPPLHPHPHPHPHANLAAF